jgi:hypothetical protein
MKAQQLVGWREAVSTSEPVGNIQPEIKPSSYLRKSQKMSIKIRLSKSEVMSGK